MLHVTALDRGSLLPTWKIVLINEVINFSRPLFVGVGGEDVVIQLD